MLRIGDFAKLCRVSVKTLRFYDEIGLLKPTLADRATGYRYYAPHLLPKLNQILAFKELGFSLAEIRSMLKTELSDEQMRSVLLRKRSELSQRIELEQQQLAQADAWLRQLSTPSQIEASPIVLKQMPTQLVAALRAQIDSYEEADELFGELQHYLRRYQRVGQRAAIWHACAGSSDHIDCEALILLNRRVPESKRVRIYELPAGTTASVIHHGREDAIEQSYHSVRQWIKAQGHEPAGPNREVYWPQAHAQTSLTEIQFPISIAQKTIAVGN